MNRPDPSLYTNWRELVEDLIGMAAIAVILAAFYILGSAVQPA